jgi:hypothetical protein
MLFDSAGFVLRSVAIHPATRGGFGANDNGYAHRALAWTGSEYVTLTTLENEITSTGLVATRVSAQGDVLQNDISIAPSGFTADVAARDGQVLFVFVKDAKVLVRKMTSPDKLEPAAEIGTFDFSGGLPLVAAGEDGFLVTWRQGTSIVAQYVPASGEWRAAAHVVIDVNEPFVIHAVTWTGSSYTALFGLADAPQRILAVETTADGAPKGAPREILSSALSVGLAYDGTRSVLAWSEADPVNGYVSARQLDSFERHAVHEHLDWQLDPSAMFYGATPYVVYRQESLGYSVNLATGTVNRSQARDLRIEGLDRPLFIVGAAGDNAEYRLGFGLDAGSGRQFIAPSGAVTWTGHSLLFLSSVSGDPAGIVVQEYDLQGMRLTAPRQISTFFNPRVMAVKSVSGNTLAVYSDGRQSIGAVMIRGDDVRDLGEIGLLAGFDIASLHIASDGSGFLVTWLAGEGGPSAYVAGRQIAADGRVSPLRAYSPAADTKRNLEVFWTGLHYFAAWNSTASQAGNSQDIKAVAIGRDGSLLEQMPRTLLSYNGLPASITYKDGQILIAYARDGTVFSRFIVRGQKVRSARSAGPP